MNCKDALLEYKNYMIVEKGYSRLTIESYLRDLVDFANVMGSQYGLINVEDVEKEHIRLYIKDMRDRLKASSVDRHMISLRRFYIFLTREGIVEKNIMSSFELPKRGKYLPDVLTLDEVNQIIDSIELKQPIDFRNRCMIELLYASGLRVSEMCQVKLSHLNLQKGFVKVIGKGNKERIVSVNEHCCLLLREYIEDYRLQICESCHSQYLFINKKGMPIQRDNFYHILEKIVKNSGVKKHVTPHTFRHTFATHLLENDADLRSIQEMLGHSDISTSTIYTHVSQNKMIDEYMKVQREIKREGTEK